jgi:DNA polymerase-1
MRHLAGDMDLTVGMHARIKKIFDEKFDISLEKADSRQLDNIMRYIGGDAGRLAESINKLRTLEKWYKTYITGVIKKSSNGRFHTQINQTGAVSGRVSSDAQQFPKEALKYKGVELFHPRKAFLADEGHTIAYADMSQVELRVQAHYTIAIKHPDTNLCRAYIPFNCRHAVDGHIYDLDKDKQRWDEKLDGQSAWLMDDGTPWTPTDTHSLTTHTSLVLMGYTCHKQYEHYTWDQPTRPLLEWTELHKEEFGKARYKGKLVNFMRNYSGGLRAAMDSLGLDKSTAQKMLDGWTASYPGVQEYQDAIAQGATDRGYVRNFFGRRYYIENLEKAYKLANYVIQGTCADLLKESIIKKDEYIRKYGLKSRILLPVHDEVQTSVPHDETHIYPELVRFMEDYDRFYIPLTSDLELTNTTWEAKKVVKLDEATV